MSYTDNPVADFNAYDRKQQRWLDRLPVCSDCGQPVQDGYYYDISGYIICPDCLESNYRKEVDDFYE